MAPKKAWSKRTIFVHAGQERSQGHGGATGEVQRGFGQGQGRNRGQSTSSKQRRPRRIQRERNVR